MSTSCYLNSVPEQVPVTITQSVIELDGDAVIARQERFMISIASPYNIYDNGTGEYKYFMLAFVPIRAASITIFKNGVQQRYGVDYFMNGTEVRLTTAATADDDFTATYLTTGTVSGLDTSLPTGTIVEFEYDDVAEVPTGWLPCVSGTTYTAAVYPALQAFLDNNQSLCAAITVGVNFELATLQGTLYRDNALVTIPKIIRI